MGKQLFKMVAAFLTVAWSSKDGSKSGNGLARVKEPTACNSGKDAGRIIIPYPAGRKDMVFTVDKARAMVAAVPVLNAWLATNPVSNKKTYSARELASMTPAQLADIQKRLAEEEGEEA